MAAIHTEATGASVRTTKLRYATSLAVPSSQLTESATVAADGTALPVLRFEYTAPGGALERFDLADGPRSTPLPNAAPGSTWTATR